MRKGTPTLRKGTPTLGTPTLRKGAEGDTHLPAAGTGMINVTICHTHGLPTANPQSSRVVTTHEIPAIGMIAHGLAMASPYTRPDAGTLRRECAGDTHLPAAGTGMINVTICHTHGLPTANPQSSRVVTTHEIPAIGMIAHGLAMASPHTRPDAGTLRRGHPPCMECVSP